MNWLYMLNVLCCGLCIVATIAIRGQCSKKVTELERKHAAEVAELKSTMKGAIDVAYKGGVNLGVNKGVEHTFAQIVASIDSGCDVTDIRDGLVNGYIPLRHMNRKVDA